MRFRATRGFGGYQMKFASNRAERSKVPIYSLSGYSRAISALSGRGFVIGSLFDPATAVLQVRNDQFQIGLEFFAHHNMLLMRISMTTLTWIKAKAVQLTYFFKLWH